MADEDQQVKLFQNIEAAFNKANNSPSAAKRYSEEAWDWYRTYVPRAYNKVRKPQLFADKKMWKQNVKMGRLYFFDYDALHKDKLDVWDAFPFVVFFDTYRSKEGHQILLGLNFHYLPPKLRMAAFRALLQFRNEKRYRRSTELQFDWAQIKALSQHKLFQHAIHAYRVDHVKSVFLEVPANYWQHTLFLPVARWQKGTARQAYKMSK